MLKYTIEEFKYLLQFHNLNTVPVYDGNLFLGYIDINLNYTHTNCLRYYKHEKYAIEAAINFLDEYVEAVKRFRSNEEIVAMVEHHNEHSVWEYDDGSGLRHHVYPITKDDVTTSEYKGTYDQIFENMERGNNSLQYCNGMYNKFVDPSIEKLYRLWQIYIPEGRSFDMYYGGGIVD